MKYHLLLLSLTLGCILAQECLENNKRLRGKTIKRKATKNSLDECLSLCKETKGCKGMLYFNNKYKKKKLRKKCFMYKSIKGTKKQANAVSAIIKNCIDSTTEKPVPITTEAPPTTPAPITTKVPAPITTEAPAPITTEAPAPITTEALAPTTSEAPAPITTEAPPTRVSCGGHFAPTCRECPKDGIVWYGASWCNGDCKWENGGCVDLTWGPVPTGVCKSILVSGDIEQRGLYFQKKSTENINLPNKTPNTAVYDNVGGNLIYHKDEIGWTIVNADDPSPIVLSNIVNTNIIQGGSWSTGVEIICLDGENCAMVEDESIRSVQDEALANHFPFNNMDRSSDGSFCSRIEHKGEVFEYTNETQNDLPVYSSGEYRLAQDNQDVERGIKGKGTYKFYPTSSNRNTQAGEKMFDPTCATCSRSSFSAMPATSIHARWYLPRGSLTEATSWELGVNIKVLNSYLHTYFMTVGWAPGGYSGIQETPDTWKAPSGKLALFSMWNSGTNNVEKVYINKEAGVKDSTFGGEGTGRKSWIDHPWTIGKKTAMKIKGQLIDSSSNLWEVSGYVKSVEEPDSWTHMATWSRAAPQDPFDYWGFSIFVEDWDRPACGQGFRHKRAAEFTSPYAKVDGKKVKLSAPSFSRVSASFDGNARHLVNQTVLSGRDVYMSTGGVPSDLLS